MNPVAEALRHPDAYPHPVEQDIIVVETHISWIFLTGTYAYKLKKPVNLGFLDFSTLDRRRHCCLEELRLNRRLCPELYIDVLQVSSSNGNIHIGDDGVPMDYVVRMVQFDRNFELDRLLGKGELTLRHVEEAASIIAAFHASAPRADQSSGFGTPEVLLKPMLENLDLTEQVIRSEAESADIGKLRNWTIDEALRLDDVIHLRKAGGMIRECHGDMHTGNMVIREGKIMIFDCIEFNPELSVIDVISDTAFLFMDLQHSAQTRLAWRFLNAYLSESGDYHGLRLLGFYCAYRALVRAKVTSIRYAQESDEKRKAETLDEHHSYLQLALDYARPRSPMLLITHGLSGSGKSTLSSALADLGGFVHIRSDVERKRLFGIDSMERSADRGLDIYSAETTQQTYHALIEAASSALAGGYTVIVDATFLKKSRRTTFIVMAEAMRCECRILCFHAPPEELRKRIVARNEEGLDASEADLRVLEMQMGSNEPPDGDEKTLCVEIDTQGKVNIESIIGLLGSQAQQSRRHAETPKK
ncbi:MAG: AAA family ATPase [Chlorobiaceae bacterium]|nr:AAA family ATPase [Chlorobiaceae bacterium]